MENLLILLSIQGFIGAYDSIYHHEFKERLSLKQSASTELRIHGLRSMLYSVLFLSFGWVQWHGLMALAFALILALELLLTLWDFVVEDKTRELPATERITHTILALNFGAILALLTPYLWQWYQYPTGFALSYHGVYSWVMTVYGIGVIPFAIREYTSYRRLRVSNQKYYDKGNAPVRDRKNILVTGGTGFIGRQLCKTLLAQGHRITITARNFEKAAGEFKDTPQVTLIRSIAELKRTDGYDVIINLAGAPIADGYWSEKKKREIVHSRIHTTRQIIDYLENADRKPELFVSSSAIGFYGAQGDDALIESSPGKDCFSHRLCVQWENTARRAQDFGVRVCLLRTGLVLGKTGGMLAAMLIPFSYGLGGRLGDGRQWMSWIHIDDLIGIVLKAVDDPHVNGPINATAPHPVRNKSFTLTLGQVLRRPAILVFPAFVLRRLLGELAEEIFLTGQKVLPRKITDCGYRFRFPSLHAAMEDIVKS